MSKVEIYNRETQSWVNTTWIDFEQIKKLQPPKEKYDYFVRINFFTRTPMVYRKRIKRE